MIYRFICSKITGGLLLAALTVLAPAPVIADGPVVSTGFGVEFASGKYGTDTRTDSLYMPVTLAVSTERLGFSLEIPYLYQSSSAVNTGIFTGAGGQMMRAQKRAAAMTGSMGAGSMTSATGAGSGVSQSGLGDIIARGGYVLVPEGDYMPRIRPYLQVKFPTGDESEALGTGTFAEGGAVELSKQIGDWYSFAEAGYVFQGKSTLLALKDYLSYDAGLGHSIGENFLPMLVVKGSTAPIAGSSDLFEVRLKLKYLATTHTGFEGYIAKGITTDSPDYGSGVAVFHEF